MARKGGGGRGRAPARRREWRIRGWRVRNLAAGGFLLFFFAAGFYLAQLYTEISALIEDRRAALTSAIYSAPHPIRAGDDIAKSALIDRLQHLSYSPVAAATRPGEYTQAPNAIAIYIRAFRYGATALPAQMVRVALDGDRVTAVADSLGAPLEEAEIEPEVVGRLLSGAPAERVQVSLGDLRPYVTKGLMATEDRYFYYHPGFDPIRIAEAAIADFRSHRLAQGASTLTQQLARTFMDRRERSFSRKFRELAVAIVLEIRLKKDEILARYINDVPMGEYQGTPIEGMPQAARYFFNKDLGEVTPAEAATLIGMIQAPTLYDPRRHPDDSRKRRDVVLGVMKNAGVIDDGAYRAAVATPIQIANPPGLRRAPYFADYVTAFVRSIPGFNGHLEGLNVYTTLDTELQADASDALLDNLERLEKTHRKLNRDESEAPLQSAAIALDAETGGIRAMVGGRDYSESQFNRAVTAERQPGSAFKPIVYLAALDPSRATFSPPLTLASVLPDEQMSFGGWIPANYERTYQPTVTVAKALFESLNVPTAYVGNRLGPSAIVRTARELGIESDLPAVLPISIGADETTLLELTGAYQVFANAGVRAAPYAIDSVVDAKGHLIYHHEVQPKQVIRPAIAYLITGALKAVLKYGTASSATHMGLDFPAAGKTGTTQDYRDAYFIGYTPKIVCGVWVGFDTPESIGLTGAQAALPAWVEFMRAAAQADPEDFDQPPGVTIEAIDPESGGIATSACPKAVQLPFLSGTEPRHLCPLHGGIFASGRAPSSPPITSPYPMPGAPPVPAPSPASSDVFGAVGKFFSGLFH
ncbi:MAG TPA: PBP1A family penicillin-binding protein [Candidatus Binataceae bacterium]|nr:PBP1A family penicillin-binding protein [Candidatus Binataceae bacterium]